eukprot:Skav223231  [mRNA]  locus=scaffold2231:227384:232356:+ [translate_table: standard]
MGRVFSLLKLSQERVETIEAALQGNMDDEDAEEAQNGISRSEETNDNAQGPRDIGYRWLRRELQRPAMAPARPDDSKSVQVTKLSNQITRHFKKCGLRKASLLKMALLSAVGTFGSNRLGPRRCFANVRR